MGRRRHQPPGLHSIPNLVLKREDGPRQTHHKNYQPRAKRPTPTLEQYGRDLTRQAAEGKLVLYTSQPNTDAQQTIDAFKAKYPEAWKRIENRRAFMEEKLGITLKPEVLPFSNIPAWLPPFWLAAGKVMAMR